MIRLILPEEYARFSSVLAADSARAYFIRLGMQKQDVYRAVYVDLDGEGCLRGLLCLRRSGILQFYSAGDYDVPGFSKLLDTLDYTYMISPESCCSGLVAAQCFSGVKLVAWIARMDSLEGDLAEDACEALQPEDLPEVDALYERVFEHHMPMAQMQEKLVQKRGRGVVVRRDGRIAATAQSEFEEAKDALIVGVATAPEQRRHGLAELCMRHLCAELLREGKTLWLQYDNPDAGRLYEKLGFNVVDWVLYCWKKEKS